MNRSICFLRAINVTGHNRIRMKDLSDMFISCGFKNVRTYIQSGNIIFDSPGKLNDGDLELKIEKAISDTFNLNISSSIRNITEIESLLSRNPYLSEKNFNPARMGVIFLREAPDENGIKKMENVNFPPDKFVISGREIFLFCPDGFGRSKLTTNFFENKMKVTGTARNWQTIMQILQIAKTED